MNDFLKYLKEAKADFVDEVNRQNWDKDLRKNAENLIIAYDQVYHKYKDLLENNQLIKLSENGLIKSNELFVFTELDKKYSNIEIVKICNETFYQANIKNNRGNVIAELYLYNEEKDFRLIIDNFPFPRKGYSFNLPVKYFAQLEYYLSTVNIDLISI